MLLSEYFSEIVYGFGSVTALLRLTAHKLGPLILGDVCGSGVNISSHFHAASVLAAMVPFQVVEKICRVSRPAWHFVDQLNVLLVAFQTTSTQYTLCYLLGQHCPRFGTISFPSFRPSCPTLTLTFLPWLWLKQTTNRKWAFTKCKPKTADSDWLLSRLLLPSDIKSIRPKWYVQNVILFPDRWIVALHVWFRSNECKSVMRFVICPSKQIYLMFAEWTPCTPYFALFVCSSWESYILDLIWNTNCLPNSRKLAGLSSFTCFSFSPFDVEKVSQGSQRENWTTHLAGFMLYGSSKGSCSLL